MTMTGFLLPEQARKTVASVLLRHREHAMDISKIISVDTVKNKISCASEKLFELISGLASAKLDVPADGLLDALFREKSSAPPTVERVLPFRTAHSSQTGIKALQAYSSPSTSRLSSAARGRWRA